MTRHRYSPGGIGFRSSAGLALAHIPAMRSRSEFSRMSDSFFLSAMSSFLYGRRAHRWHPTGFASEETGLMQRNGEGFRARRLRGCRVRRPGVVTWIGLGKVGIAGEPGDCPGSITELPD